MTRRKLIKLCAYVATSSALCSFSCRPYTKDLKCSETLTPPDGKTRIEPIFNLRTPLLFAHRGGAREVPESTIQGFEHAISNAKSDVLELDVQITKDGQIVVWHGPKLDNVKIIGEHDKPRCRKRRDIVDFTWSELEGKAWVADPQVVDLSVVPQEDTRCLMLLSNFMQRFNRHPLNIELKESFSDAPNRSGLEENIKTFADILDKHGGDGRIVVVSASHRRINQFRKCTDNRYPTGLSFWEQIFFTGEGKASFAFETSYFMVCEALLKRVRNSCSSLFVFITAYGPIHALDNQDTISEDNREKIFRLLDMGVDGIMTDRPQTIRNVIDDWKERNQTTSIPTA